MTHSWILTLAVLALINLSCTSDMVQIDNLTSNEDQISENRIELADNASHDSTIPKTSISFDKDNFDFGAMQVGEKSETYFSFTNTGSEALIISSAKGSCGCTVPEWPKEPIAPGASGQLKVVFNAKSAGKQTKTVTIQANTDPNPTRLTIKADVNQ